MGFFLALLVSAVSWSALQILTAVILVWVIRSPRIDKIVSSDPKYPPVFVMVERVGDVASSVITIGCLLLFIFLV